MSRPSTPAALFLDRDGVVNVDTGYVHRREDFIFKDGIFDLARAAHGLGYRLVVATNQAGIARGLYTEADFLALTEWMCARFRDEGAPIERVYFSPYHPTAGLGAYRQDHDTRKPKPGMLLQAQRELQLDMASSILIGDKPSDIHAGIAAGVGRNVLLQEDGIDLAVDADCVRIRRLSEALPLLAVLVP
jgi:D-glycero-D-manno-heptose 1,7-bisphosphate phosphatase